MSSVFIKAPNFPCSHLITPPPTSVSHRTCSQYEPPALPTTSQHTHTHTDAVCRTCSYVPKRPSASSPLCVMYPPTGITHELPLLHPPRSLLFNLEFHYNRISWTFYISFSCATDVLDWHKVKDGEREREKERERERERECGRAGNALSRPMKEKKKLVSYQITSMRFLFSLHVNARVCSLPLRCILRVTARSGHQQSGLKAAGRLSIEVCGQRPSLPIDCDQTSAACFFDDVCPDQLA